MKDLSKQSCSNDSFQHPFIQSIRMQNVEDLAYDIYMSSEIIRNNAWGQFSFVPQGLPHGLTSGGLRRGSTTVSDFQSSLSPSTCVNGQSEYTDDEIGLLHLIKAPDRSNDEFSFSDSNYEISNSESSTLRLSSSFTIHRDLNMHVCPFNDFIAKITYNNRQLLGKGGLSNVYRANLQIHRRQQDSDRSKVNCETSLLGSKSLPEKCFSIEVAAKKTFITSEILMNGELLPEVVSLLKMRHSINHSGLVRAFLIFFFSDDSATDTTRQQLSSPSQLEKPRLENPHSNSFFILSLLELSRDGTLSNKLNQCEQIGEVEIRHMLWDILPGLCYLHEKIGVVHNDIKPQNILLFSRSPASRLQNGPQGSTLQYKLGDFGHSRFVQPINILIGQLHRLRHEILTNTTRKRLLAGTVLYMSPESCIGLDDSPSNDIWSIGITVFQLATGHLPWRPVERAVPDVVRHGFMKKFSQGFLLNPDVEDVDFNTKPSFGNSFDTFGPILDEIESSEFSPEFVDFVKWCLTEDFRNRPTCSSLLEHPFLSGGQPDLG
ncbi:unnamed protein product [Phytomonas sp. Hart1]|nr:unnamed protein product [Phytomonas sp. Hart1]|eukprot:CCW68327.1 unnamed protein product [Phytomonas sp. isolate Hart1]